MLQTDLGPVAHEAERLTEAADRFYRERGRDPGRTNETIKRVSRVLVPLRSTRGDRFGQDREVEMGPFPGLDEVRKLPSLGAWPEERGFFLTALLRQRNRVAAALKRATALLSSEDASPDV